MTPTKKRPTSHTKDRIVSRGNCNAVASRPLNAKEKRPIESMERGLVDVAMLDLFNKVSHAVGAGIHYDLHGREKSVKRSYVESLRSELPKLNPTKYGEAMKHLDTTVFQRHYLLSKFFGRYIFDRESSREEVLRVTHANDFHVFCKSNAHMIDDRSFAHLDVVRKMRELMHQILGDDFSRLRLYELCKHGPNSTTTIPLTDSYVEIKVRDIRGTRFALQEFWCYLQWDTLLYHNLLREARVMVEDPGLIGTERRYFEQLIDYLEHRVIGDMLIQEASRTSWVAKKWDTLRTICVEPTIDMFFQLGLGRYLACILRDRCNIDLSSQPRCHQLLARLASSGVIDDATVDWSEASDRIWRCLVRDTSPSHWFKWLDTFRSKSSECCAGEGHNKFSVALPMMGTMGNGFTFPLQTLIFYVFLTACCEQASVSSISVSSFGDDGIVPSRAMPYVEWNAQLLGWKLNVEKSFSGDNPFRESCGGDFHNGFSCRPFQPERVEDLHPRQVQAYLYQVANNATHAFDGILGGTADGVVLPWLRGVFARFSLGKIHIVPTYYSETSGYRYDNPDPWIDLHPRLAFAELDPSSHFIPRRERSGEWTFRAILPKKVEHHVPIDLEWVFYWSAMKRDYKDDEYAVPEAVFKYKLSRTWEAFQGPTSRSYDASQGAVVCAKKVCRYTQEKCGVMEWHHWHTLLS